MQKNIQSDLKDFVCLFYGREPKGFLLEGNKFFPNICTLDSLQMEKQTCCVSVWLPSNVTFFLKVQ